MRADQPSATAILIARCTLLATRDPILSPLVPSDAGPALTAMLAAVGGGQWFDFALRHLYVRKLLSLIERAILPGISAHYLARKCWLEQRATSALNDGCSQLVVLGAGFDTLAWRMHRIHPTVRFFELDHPATQGPKASALATSGNFSLIPSNLANTLPSADLRACPTFVPTARTFFIAEGLLMYFPAARVAEILSDLSQFPNAMIAFTFMAPGPDGRAAFRGGSPAIDAWLRIRREPFAWAIAPENVAEFLRPLGLCVSVLAGAEELRETIPARSPLAQGEHLCFATTMTDPLLVNDVHSKLNTTAVARILTPCGLEEIIAIVHGARAAGAQLSISGGRHAMGGQQFGTGTWLLDLRRHAAVHYFDAERGLITVDAGIQWPALIAACAAAPVSDHGVQWGIRQKQTGADRLTLGGSLAANVHGRSLRMPPIVSDVEAFTLIGADALPRRCSRTENADLFALAIGGYGMFGIIADVTLRLSPRVPVQRSVEIITLDELVRIPEDRDTSDWLFGDFQYSIDERSKDFLHRGVFSAYRRSDIPPSDAPQKQLQESDWIDLLALAHTDRAKVFDVYSNYYRSTHGQRYWSDKHQLSIYPDHYHAAIDARLHSPCPCSEMISELYVPRDALSEFMTRAAELLRSGETPVIYGTVRLIERDTETVLAWAREPWACVIFNLHCEHTPTGLALVADAFRALIDIALSFGGSYYLTYHRWATRDQVAAAHPRFHEFLTEKIARDPTELFTSDWYRHHRDLFAE